MEQQENTYYTQRKVFVLYYSQIKNNILAPVLVHPRICGCPAHAYAK